MANKKKSPKIVREIQNNPPEPVNFAFEKNISYSQLSMYTQCPKKWALQYRDGYKIINRNLLILLMRKISHTPNYLCIHNVLKNGHYNIEMDTK